MASMNKLVLMPEISEIRNAFGFSTTKLFRRDMPLSTRWFLRGANMQTSELRIDFDDVVFKFECFGFMLRNLDESTQNRFENSQFVSDMSAIELVYLVEWERPALPGEVSENYEQIKRCTGRLSDVPNNAIGACVSLVGFVWASQEVGVLGRRAALFHDAGETLTVPNFSTDQKRINDLLATHTVVKLNELPRWYEEVAMWLATG